MTSEIPQQPLKPKKYAKGSPYVCRKGNAIFFFSDGKPWVIGIPRMLSLIRGKSRFHYLNPSPRALEKMRQNEEQKTSYKGIGSLSGIIDNDGVKTE